jgi:histidinol-phosphatase (PHP family)
MELNTSGLNKAIAEMNPNPRMLRAMREREIPVVVGGDAHTPQRVGDRFLDAYSLLGEAGYGEVSYFLGRERQVLPIEVARRSLEEASAAARASAAGR